MVLKVTQGLPAALVEMEGMVRKSWAGSVVAVVFCVAREYEVDDPPGN